MTQSWEELANTKRESILAAIPQEWRIQNPPIEEQVDVTGSYIQQFLTTSEIHITEASAVDIVDKIAKGEWTSEEVTRAFCHRAALAHQLLHCLHEIFFDAAIASAKALDAYYAEHKTTVGPLHGLPVSLKDQFHVKDVETTMGYVGWIGTFEGKKGTRKEKVVESEMVRELRECGAVLYCKTSVPHTLMAGETVNNIIGYTLNPKNRRLTAGGSSGGEGALIGIRGSPLGLGTDIGGSIRIPSAFNGIAGLRPSTGRLPYAGMANSMDGQNSVLSVVGPLAPSVPALTLLSKAILSTKPWLHDPLVHEIPWRDDHVRDVEELIAQAQRRAADPTKKLCFAVLRSDGVVNPLPPVRRALAMAVEAVEAQGHKVIEWNPPSHAAINDTVLQSWRFDMGADVKAAFALSGEPMAPQVAFFGELEGPEKTGSEIAAVNIRLRELRKEYLDYWVGTREQTGTGRPVDAVIAPLAPFPAARREKYRYYGYSVFVNGLDVTSVAVPVTVVDKGIDGVDEEYKALSELDQKVYEDYEPEIYDGAHVSLQLLGMRLQEEKMLTIAEFVGNAVRQLNTGGQQTEN